MGEFNATNNNLTNTKTNYVNEWVNVSVNNEILRGKKLREQKSNTYIVPNKTYDVVDLKYENPFCYEHQKYHKKSYNNKRIRLRKCYEAQTNPCTPRCNSRASSPARTYITMPTNIFSKSGTKSVQSRARKVRKCPLRIAELAMPSKRQCIETWKNKSHSLPAFMIERLKQHVMDQIPVAKIPDAINCFKRRAHPPTIRSSSKRPGSSCRNSTKYDDRCMMEIRKFCVIFGHQIAQRMYSHQNIELNPELEKLSYVVAGELQNILRNPKLVIADDDNNRKLLKEMSTKVTVWIHSVLENAAEKLLEEELMAKKRKERESQDDHYRVTVVQRHMSVRHEEVTELEEEEGPALDFLDDVMERVVKNCIPSPANEILDEQHSPLRDQSSIKGEMSDSESDDSSFLGGRDSEQNSFNEDDIRDQLKNALYNRLDEIIVEERASDDTEGTKELLSKKFTQVPDEGNHEIQGNEEQIKKLLNDIIDENVSEVFVVLTEEPFDERKTTVKFSHVDNGLRHARGINYRYRHHSPRSQQIVPFVLENKPDLVIGPPNENLLSDVDESWPEEFSAPTLKISESVCKSITSLGRIEESEEKYSIKSADNYLDATEQVLYSSYMSKPTQELAESSLTDNEDSKVAMSIVSGNLSIESFHPIKVEIRKSGNAENAMADSLPNVNNVTKAELEKKNLKGNQTKLEIEDKDKAAKTLLERIHEEFRKAKLEQAIAKKVKLYEVIHDQQSILTDKMICEKEKEIARHDLEKKTELNQPIEGQQLEKVKKIDVTGSDSFKGSGKGDHRDTDAETDVISKAIQRKIKNTQAHATKFDYKVHPQTAPAWAVVPACQSSDDSFSNINQKRIPQKNVQNNDLHKWCNDLDRTLVNLQQWNAWVEKTCKKMMYLKTKTETNKVLDPSDKTSALHDWIKYKKNIDKEAMLWRKLNQRTKEVLQTYNFKDRVQPCVQPKPKPRCDNSSQMPVKPIITKSILDALSEFDRICVWTHRMIVSTEYCMKCHCKYYTKPATQFRKM